MSNRIGVRLNFAKKVALVVAGTAALGAPIVLGWSGPPKTRDNQAHLGVMITPGGSRAGAS